MATIDVALVTWPNHPKRWEYFSRCIPALLDGLTATGYDLRYVCSSESEVDPKHEWFGEQLKEFCEKNGIELAFREAPASLGANMNAALRMCKADTIFLVQDDWLLNGPCDIGPGADYLRDRPDVDYIRYSWPGDLCTFVPQADGWTQITHQGHWPYGDDPQLRRPGFTDKFGWYLEGGRHGRSESNMVYAVKAKHAYIIAADKNYFSHFGEVASVINEYRERAVSR